MATSVSLSTNRSSDGQIVVTAARDNGRVRLAVRDDGEGIDTPAATGEWDGLRGRGGPASIHGTGTGAGGYNQHQSSCNYFKCAGYLFWNLEKW